MRSVFRFNRSTWMFPIHIQHEIVRVWGSVPRPFISTAMRLRYGAIIDIVNHVSITEGSDWPGFMSRSPLPIAQTLLLLWLCSLFTLEWHIFSVTNLSFSSSHPPKFLKCMYLSRAKNLSSQTLKPTASENICLPPVASVGPILTYVKLNCTEHALSYNQTSLFFESSHVDFFFKTQ